MNYSSNRRTLVFVACLLAIAMFSVGPGTARAGLVGYDGFDYSNGNLQGQTGGFGWGGSWSHVVGTTTIHNGVAKLAFTGGQVDSQVSRSLGTTLGADNTTTWVRFNGGYFNSSAFPPSSLFGGLRLMNGGAESLLIGKFGSGTAWSIGSGTNTASTTVAVNGAEADIWVRINHLAGNDAVKIWVNPTVMTSELNLNGATAELTALDVNFNGAMLHAHRGGLTPFSNHAWQFDNVRIGTSFGAMSAVPEPSALALVGILTVATIVVRRRTV